MPLPSSVISIRIWSPTCWATAQSRFVVLPGRHALFRGFHTVIDSIAHQMNQRIVQILDHGLVEFGSSPMMTSSTSLPSWRARSRARRGYFWNRRQSAACGFSSPRFADAHQKIQLADGLRPASAGCWCRGIAVCRDRFPVRSVVSGSWSDRFHPMQIQHLIQTLGVDRMVFSCCTGAGGRLVGRTWCRSSQRGQFATRNGAVGATAAGTRAGRQQARLIAGTTTA